MQKIRYWARLLSAFASRFKGLIFVGVVLGALAFLLVALILPIFVSKKTIRYGLTGRFTPDDLPLSVLNLVGSGLTRVGPDGIVEPNLAYSWETPDKGKTWIFYLKKDLTWQDGTKISSHDINYQFSDVVAEKPDDGTVVFKLADAFSPFPSVVARPVFKRGFLGTGEWKLTNVSLAGNFVQSLDLVHPTKGTRIYKFYPTEERTKLALKMGHVDIIEDIFNPDPLGSWETLKAEKISRKHQIVTLFFNTENQLFADNKPLRQALNYAIDKSAFDSERAISPVPPDSWVYNPQVKPYEFDLERAKELLKEVEIANDTQIKLVTSPVLLEVAEDIAAGWEKAGVKTLVQVSSVVPTDFQVYLTILDAPSDPDQYSFWHSKQKDSTNISNFGNARIDKLLEDGRVILDLNERKTVYLDFQRFIVEELPAAFLYHPATYTISRK